MPPLSLLIKPASGSCNMRCRYCFYVDETRNRAVALRGCMSEQTVHALVDKALEYADGVCTFSFQGGEPTLAGLDFFCRMSDYAAAHPNSKGVEVRWSIQTNGYALDEDWCRWLRDNRVLVGISLDGPKEIHDRCRVDTEGKGTFQKVMHAIRLLEKYGVEFNILTVVSAFNTRRAQQVYQFFKKQNFAYQQYKTFLKTMFDEWYRDVSAGRYVYNRYFENLLMIMTGQQPESCSLRGVCQAQWVIEADGTVYPCDFYALDQWRLGNINTDSFADMEAKRRESGFIAQSARVPDTCRSCRWVMLCRNGCRRNRAEDTGQNRFCSAYQGFLEYAYPRLQELAQAILRRAGKR